MIAVDALDDPRLADYRLLAQPDALRQRNLFVAEGRLVLPRLLATPRIRTRSMLLSQTAWDAIGTSIETGAPDVPAYVLPQARMNELIGFDIHRGCVALAERPAIPLLSKIDLTSATRVVVLEGINNPDNVGGIFRSAAAFGVDLIVLGPGCGDPFYRKAIRTSMGATLSVPFAEAGVWPGALDQLRAQRLRVIALTPAPTAMSLQMEEATAPRIALLLGTEGNGLSTPAMAGADSCVRIAISPTVDSLNVAVAAAIALHYFTTGALDR